jgi:predicted nucleic acid-binding protein
MAQIVFDTSVLLASAFDEPKAGEVEKRMESIAGGTDLGLISAVTVAEFFEKASRAGRRELAIKFFETLKESGFFIADITEDIAKLAGPLKARFPQLSTADALIATTAYVNKAKLFTYDKGFWGVGGIDLIGI